MSPVKSDRRYIKGSLEHCNTQSFDDPSPLYKHIQTSIVSFTPKDKPTQSTFATPSRYHVSRRFFRRRYLPLHLR